MVAPGVLQAATCLLRTNGSLPAIGIPEAVSTTVYHTTAREAHELRMEVGKCLSEVFAQTVSLVSILRHQRDHIDVHIAIRQHQNLQSGLLAVGIRRQRSRIFLPFAGIGSQLDVIQQLGILPPALWLNESDTDFLSSTVVADENRKVVLCTSLHGDAVVTVVFETIASPALEVVELSGTLGMQTHVSGVIGMDASVFAHIHRTE